MHIQIDNSLSDRMTVWIDVADRSVNVFHEAVFDAIDALLESESVKNSALPLVFRSAKKKGFVVGADLKRILAIQSDEEIQSFLERGQRVFSKLEELRNVTIAVVQGACLGGGLEFALACTYRLAIDSPDTQFGMPESKLGLMPGWGGTQRLIEHVGMEEGLDMLIRGESISAEQAVRIRLVDELLSPKSLEDQLTQFLARTNPATGRKWSFAGQCQEERERFVNRFELDAQLHERLSDAQTAILKAVGTGNSTTAGTRLSSGA